MFDAAREEYILRASPLFGGMNQETAQSLIAEMIRVEAPKGAALFEQGELGQDLFIIVKGKVKIVQSARDGREHLMALLGAGDMFGELSVFDPGPRLSRGHVVERAVLYQLSKEKLDKWLDVHLETGRYLLRALARRLRREAARNADLVFSDVSGRVAKALLDLAQRFGRVEKGEVVIRHGLTQEELAQLVGASRETVNKVLADFSQRGWLELQIGSVRLLELDRIRGRTRV